MKGSGSHGQPVLELTVGNAAGQNPTLRKTLSVATSYRALQAELAAHPNHGDVMPGSGGFRKMRWGDPRRKVK